MSTGTPLCMMRWRKLVWSMAFNGLCTVGGRPTREVLEDPQLRERLLAGMAEVVAAATADGADLEPDLIAAHLRNTEAMPSDVPSMVLDARAARHGVAMPEATALLWGAREPEGSSSQPGLRGLTEPRERCRCPTPGWLPCPGG